MVAVGLMVWTLGCGAPPPPAGGGPAGSGDAAMAAAPWLPDAMGTADGKEELPVMGFGMVQELEDVTFRQSQGTVTQWELHADTVRETAEAPARLTGVTLRYYGDDAGPTVITADEADYSPDTQQAALRGNVRIATATGDSLVSEALDWDAENRKLSTDVLVTLRRGGSHITGVGLRTSPGLEDVEIFQVRGIIHNSELAG